MAILYWRGLTNPNWGTASNWSTGSTSTLGGTVPTAVDDLIFDANSSACTVNVAGVCRTINFSAYTRTITMTNNINVGSGGVSGVVLGASMGISGTGPINVLNHSGNLTSNGRVWPNAFGFGSPTGGGAATLSLTDGWVISGTCTFGTAGVTTTMSGGNISAFTNVNVVGSVRTAGASNPTVTMLGNGFFSANTAINILSYIINAGSNTVTIPGILGLGSNTLGAGFLSYSSGTVNTSGSTLNLYAQGVVLDTKGTTGDTPTFTSSTGINFFNVSVNASNTTLTLNSPLTISNNFTNIGNSSTNLTMNGSSVYIGGDWISTVGQQPGTSSVFLVGTGRLETQVTNSSSGIGNPITIRTPGTITITGATLALNNNASFTYISGTTITTGNTLQIRGSATLDTGGMVWNNVGFAASVASTITLQSDLNVSGSFTGLATITAPGTRTINGNNINISGNCSLELFTSAGFAGTTTYRLRGGGYFSVSGLSATVEFGNNLVFESGAGTYNIIGTIRYRSGTITYTSGIINTSNSTLNLVNTVPSSLNTNGMSWGTVNFTLGGTYSIASTFSALTANLTSTTNTTFSGAGGVSFGSFSWTNGVSSQTLTLTQGNQYIVRSSLLTRGTLSFPITFVSSSGSLRTIFTLNNSATQDLGFTSATRIDSSLGQTIYTRRGVITDTINWQLLVNPSTVSKSFILQ